MPTKLSAKKKKNLINTLSSFTSKPIPVKKTANYTKKIIAQSPVSQSSTPGLSSFGGGKLRIKKGLKNNLYNKIK